MSKFIKPPKPGAVVYFAAVSATADSDGFTVIEHDPDGYCIDTATWSEMQLCENGKHDWEVSGYAEPDGGVEHFDCRRCGECHSIRFY